MKTNDYLDEIAKKHCKPDGTPASDYKVAQLLGMNHQSISQYRTKGMTFNDETAIKAGELLDMPGYIVIADMNSERAFKKGNKQVMEAWQEITKKISGSAAALVLGTAMAIHPAEDVQAEFNITNFMAAKVNNNIYYAVLMLLFSPGFLLGKTHKFIQELFTPDDKLLTPAYI